MPGSWGTHEGGRPERMDTMFGETLAFLHRHNRAVALIFAGLSLLLFL